MINKDNLIQVILIFVIYAINYIGNCHAQGFIENKGQFPQDVLYMAKLADQNILLMQDKLVIQSFELKKNYAYEEPDDDNYLGPNPATFHVTNQIIRFIDSHNLRGSIFPMNLNPTCFNFFLGNRLEKWTKNVHESSSLIIKDLYDGVDLMLSITEGRLNADWSIDNLDQEDQINICVIGTDEMIGKSNGKAAVDMLSGIISNAGIKNSQNEIRRIVSQSFIHPDLLYSTYFGGSSSSCIHDIDIDIAGYVYLTGITWSMDFPATPGAYDTTVSGLDCFLAKLDTSDFTIKFATLLGGQTGTDLGKKIEVLEDKNLIVVGGQTNSPDFPVTPNCLQPAIGGLMDCFVAFLSIDGDSLIRSTFFGGPEHEVFIGMVTGTDGSVTICGSTPGDTPTTLGSYQPFFSTPVPVTFNDDGFITRINDDLDSLFFSTYLGGVEGDVIYELKTDKQGDYLIAGKSSGSFPIVAGAYDSSFNGVSDGFISILSANGDSLIYSSYLGGMAADLCHSVVFADNGDIILCGSTSSVDFPVTPFSWDTVFNNQEIYVIRFDSTLTQIKFSTFLGVGGSVYAPFHVEMSTDENLLVSGNLMIPPAIPLTVCAFDDSASVSEGFLCKLKSDGTALLYSTYIGGSGSESVMDIAEMAADTVLIAGTTTSTDYYTTPGCLDSTYNCPPSASDNSILTLLALSVYPRSDFHLPPVVCIADSFMLMNDSRCTTSYKWFFGDGDSSFQINPVHLYNQTGTYYISLVASNIAGSDTLVCMIDVLPAYALTIDTSVCEGDSVWAAGQYRFTPGLYIDSLSSAYGCDSLITTSLSIKGLPIINLPEDTVFCTGETLVLDAGNAGTGYLWSTGSTAHSIGVNQAGQYSVTVTNLQGCSAAAHVNVTIYPLPDIELPDSSLICEGEYLELHATGCDSCHFLWSNGDTLPFVTINQTGTYWVKTTDLHCSKTDTIDVGECADIVVPNVFTPNGDDFNELFKPITKHIRRLDLMIFNAWGSVVHQSEGPEVSWDGMINNHRCPEGTYFWVIRWEGLGTGSRPRQGGAQGAVMLLR